MFQCLGVIVIKEEVQQGVLSTHFEKKQFYLRRHFRQKRKLFAYLVLGDEKF